MLLIVLVWLVMRKGYNEQRSYDDSRWKFYSNPFPFKKDYLYM